MIANDNRPDSAPPENRLTPTILTAALAIGIVAYVVMAWALQSFGAGQPSVLGENRRVAVYASWPSSDWAARRYRSSSANSYCPARAPRRDKGGSWRWSWGLRWRKPLLSSA